MAMAALAPLALGQMQTKGTRRSGIAGSDRAPSRTGGTVPTVLVAPLAACRLLLRCLEVELDLGLRRAVLRCLLARLLELLLDLLYLLRALDGLFHLPLGGLDPHLGLTLLANLLVKAEPLGSTLG